MNIALLLSGGVDSSVALRLLQEAGHTVTAFYLKIWLEDELSFLGTCPWEEDLNYVQAVCKQANVPLEIISLQKEYWQEVVSYALVTLRAGRTPNPDMLCNQRIKFGMFYDKIDSSFDKVATGHYAQVIEENGIYRLALSPDDIKDQTYFLAALSQEQLARACFPIGHLTKNQVRAYAQQFDLPTKDRKDSQGICFLGKLKFNDFVRFHLGERPGHLVEHETGNIVGEHKGYWFYTIGQRQGIGLAGGPWYVVAKDIEQNTIFISRSYYTHDKLRDSVEIGNCSWLTGVSPETGELFVKLRHGPHRYPASLDAVAAGRYRLTLADRDQGIAPGQFAVLYDKAWCLGGGEIIG
jgi:tRNA-specific 2-thiouridylase